MQRSYTLPVAQRVLFDDPRLVADAGLLLPATLAQRLGLAELLDTHVELGRGPGAAHVADKGLTVVMSALAGGDCIDDVAALRAGATAAVLGHRVAAPSTVGTFLRCFRWGHARQLDRVSRALLARAWTAGAGPGDASLTIDLDSTLCETYGLAKAGASQVTRTGQRGYHPLVGFGPGPPSSSMPGSDAAGPRPARVRPASWPRRSAGCARPARPASSPCAPTPASTPAAWSSAAAGARRASPSVPG